MNAALLQLLVDQHLHTGMYSDDILAIAVLEQAAFVHSAALICCGFCRYDRWLLQDEYKGEQHLLILDERGVILSKQHITARTSYTSVHRLVSGIASMLSKHSWYLGLNGRQHTWSQTTKHLRKIRLVNTTHPGLHISHNTVSTASAFSLFSVCLQRGSERNGL